MGVEDPIYKLRWWPLEAEKPKDRFFREIWSWAHRWRLFFNLGHLKCVHFMLASSYWISFRLSYLFDRFLFKFLYWNKFFQKTPRHVLSDFWRQCRCLIFLRAMVFESASIFCFDKPIHTHLRSTLRVVNYVHLTLEFFVCIHEDCISFIILALQW